MVHVSSGAFLFEAGSSTGVSSLAGASSLSPAPGGIHNRASRSISRPAEDSISSLAWSPNATAIQTQTTTIRASARTTVEAGMLIGRIEIIIFRTVRNQRIVGCKPLHSARPYQMLAWASILASELSRNWRCFYSLSTSANIHFV